MKLGLREQTKEFKKCFGREKMRALVRVEGPTVDGFDVKSWAGLRRKITQLFGEGSIFANGQPKNPLAVVNQDLLTFNSENLENLESSQNASAVCSVLAGMPTPSEPERLHELPSYSGLSMSSGWKFSIDYYSEAELTKGFV